MAKKVFLVHVRDPQFFSVPADKPSKNGRVQIMGFPPIGIMSLSSVAKRAGHEVVMFDQANPATPNSVIIEEMRRRRPDFVGLSFLSTTSYPYARKLARELRAADSSVRIAMGGVFASLNARNIKEQCPEVDYICRGDGEEILLDVLERLDDPDGVAGLTWADKKGALRHNPDRPICRDLDQWPFPDRESLPTEYVECMPLDVPAVLSHDRFTTMQTSRGCPRQCIFCDIPSFSERRWRPRSAEHVVAELKHLENQGYRAVHFIDDDFLLRPERVELICNGIRRNRLQLHWNAEGRVDSRCVKLLPTMRKANCLTLTFGIESGSQNILNRLRKQQTLEQIENAITSAKRAGIQVVHGFFVVGNPDETEEDLRKTFDFAAKIPIDTFNFNRLCVYRGTPLWKEYVQRGLIDDEKDWYKFFKCSEIDPTILPGEVIHRIRSKGIRKIFFHKLLHHPFQVMKVLRRFVRHLSMRAFIVLLVKPFLGQKSGATQAEKLSREV